MRGWVCQSMGNDALLSDCQSAWSASDQFAAVRRFSQLGQLARRIALNSCRISGSLASAASLSFCSRSGVAGMPSITAPSGTSFVMPAIALSMRPVADVHVVAQPGLAAHHDVVAGRRAAGDADLRSKSGCAGRCGSCGRFARGCRSWCRRRSIVAPYVPRSTVVPAPISTSLPILHVAELRGQHVPPVDLRIAKAVRADHRAAVNDRAVADDGVFVKHDAGADRRLRGRSRNQPADVRRAGSSCRRRSDSRRRPSRPDGC